MENELIENILQARASLRQTTKEVDDLIAAVLHFTSPAINSNACWPTAKKWTLKEAKDALRSLADSAQKSIRK